MTFTRMFSVLPSSSHPPTVLPERSRAGDKRYREYACLSALRSRKDKVDAEVTFRETSPSFAAAFVRESTARPRGYFMRKPGWDIISVRGYSDIARPLHGNKKFPDYSAFHARYIRVIFRDVYVESRSYVRARGLAALHAHVPLTRRFNGAI